MARKQARPPATNTITLRLLQTTCRTCGSQMRIARHSHRTVTTLQGVTRLTSHVYRCRNTTYPRFHLDVIALVETRSLLGATENDLVPLLEQAGYSHRRSDHRWATLHPQCGGAGLTRYSPSILPVSLPA
jgi:hypothetical protein